MSKMRPATPHDPLTDAEASAVAAFYDEQWHTVSDAARSMATSPGNFGVRVRRLYEKGRLEFRQNTGEYRLTTLGLNEMRRIAPPRVRWRRRAMPRV